MISVLRFLNCRIFVSFHFVYVLLFPSALVGMTVIWSDCMSRRMGTTQQCPPLKANAYCSTLVEFLLMSDIFTSTTVRCPTTSLVE